ncbi:MAG: DUF3662 and FHA domain-containing protein [Dehalococcoidia bacterium]|nr:DUF3662 and FHA domain-containing protein [Dehalococcoidia bacterium]
MAKALDRLEETLERVMKETITQRLGGRLHPVEIARKLAQAMDANQTITAQRILVPNFYVVHLNPADLATLEPFRATLERELAAYLSQAMDEGDLSAVSYPHVDLLADEGVPRRKIRVQAQIVEGKTAPSLDQQAGHTVRLESPAASGLPGRARLVLPASEGKELVYPVGKLPFSLGRALDNDLILEGRGVSRYHAQIRVLYGRPYLVDLGSTNGTSVNGRNVSETILKDGDIISLGPVRLFFRLEEK